LFGKSRLAHCSLRIGNQSLNLSLVRKSGSRSARRTPTENFFGKIQSICNGKCAPITMQDFAQASENPRAQEQWQAMEKTMRRTIGNSRKIRVSANVRLDAGRQGDGAARESDGNEKARR